jgi:hypothetical protein
MQGFHTELPVCERLFQLASGILRMRSGVDHVWDES